MTKFNLLNWFSILCFLLTFGCAESNSTKPLAWVAPSLSVKVNKEFEPQKINSIAIVPLEANPSVFIPKTELESLTRKFTEAFGLYTSLNFVDPQTPNQEQELLKILSTTKAPMSSRALTYGKKLGAQGVLMGVVNDFSHSHNDFNRVSFQISLIETASSKVMWSVTYESHNRPLSDNLFRVGQALKQGVSFKTPEQLIQIGFNEAAKKLEEIRQ